jgi:hypothetical protein
MKSIVLVIGILEVVINKDREWDMHIVTFVGKFLDLCGIDKNETI